MREYDHLEIEKKWQSTWVKKKAYFTPNSSKKKKHYVLDMFPYPSGTGLHVGHPKGYIGSDVYARMKRMQGFNVLHPMGYDAFGLPAEQYALEHHIHPRKAVEENIKTFESQLMIIGLSYDWSRKVNTTDPAFYKWTQWMFLKMYGSWYNKKTDKAEPIETLVKKFEKEDSTWKMKSEKEKQDELMKYRIAYEGYSEVNWSPILGTVLANDEIVDTPKGPVSERGGYPVVKKQMRQWFLRTTEYADRLLTGLDKLNWSEHLKEIQRNWIGKSDGSEIEFQIVFDHGQKPGRIPVFTTRPDTLFGATYMVLAPEHPWVTLAVDNNHIGVLDNREEVLRYIAVVKNKTEAERTDDKKEKTGVELKGVKAINPANGEKIPLFVADYVLAHYGTGAIMAVPAHDERDFEFAKKYNLPIKKVIEINFNDEKGLRTIPYGKRSMAPQELILEYDHYEGDGYLIHSGEFTGMPTDKAKKKITEFVGGKIVTKYKMRDAVFARQRYWGEPIPLRHNKDGTITPLRDRELPLKLPEVKSYQPTGTGESPLAAVKSWVKQGLETNTMPGWAGSSWYFLRYMDAHNKKAFADRKAINYWRNVDMYVGGAEHATGHLLYSRFWHMFLKDLDLVVTDEPFQTLKNQGLILGTDNRKMSKRWGNTIDPRDVVRNYGADTLRVYEMFMGPFEGSMPWSTDNIIGSRRFIERVWRLSERVNRKAKQDKKFTATLHKTIRKVSEDIESFAFNTAVSAMMILVNEMDKLDKISKSDFELFLKILSPFAPHMTEELWSNLGHKSLLVQESWPRADKNKMLEEEVTIAVQINGKVRSEAHIVKGLSQDEIVSIARGLPDVEKWIMNREIKKIIYIKDKLLNLVVA